jgi:hypothetical protein
MVSIPFEMVTGQIFAVDPFTYERTLLYEGLVAVDAAHWGQWRRAVSGGEVRLAVGGRPVGRDVRGALGRRAGRVSGGRPAPDRPLLTRLLLTAQGAPFVRSVRFPR